MSTDRLQCCGGDEWRKVQDLGNSLGKVPRISALVIRTEDVYRSEIRKEIGEWCSRSTRVPGLAFAGGRRRIWRN